MERYWVFTVPSPQAAADAVRLLDEFPLDKVAGLGVVSKPSVDGPDRLYLFVHGEQLLFSDADAIERILERSGRQSNLGIDRLAGTQWLGARYARKLRHVSESMRWPARTPRAEARIKGGR